MVAVAQLVEQWTVTPCVAGSIPVSHPIMNKLHLIESVTTHVRLRLCFDWSLARFVTNLSLRLDSPKSLLINYHTNLFC